MRSAIGWNCPFSLPFIIMKTCSPITDFHNWLSAQANGQGKACSIIIHHGEAYSSEALIQKIADYLNEYDDEGDGRWLAATQDLVRRVSGDPFLRQLVGLEYEIPKNGASRSSTFDRTYSALAHRGRVIGRQSEVFDRSSQQHFDVGVGNMSPGKCHMVLNPDKIHLDQMAPIISDVFLEWLHSGIVRHHATQSTA